MTKEDGQRGGYIDSGPVPKNWGQFELKQTPRARQAEDTTSIGQEALPQRDLIEHYHNTCALVPTVIIELNKARTDIAAGLTALLIKRAAEESTSSEHIAHKKP